MIFLSEMDPKTGFLPADIGQKGAELRSAYHLAEPFPHIVIDDFVPPALLDHVLAHFPREHGAQGMVFDRPQERAKFQYMPDELAPPLRTIFYAFNARPFMRLLENITGIPRLIPDPHFAGGGLHEIRQGGHLSIHADFNHHEPMDLERRINVLIYLNKDWGEEFGGQLELWDKRMTRRVKSILPSFNRCVIFNTSEDSNHGNPQPIDHPQAVSRKAIALFYYTATWSPRDKRDYSSQFRVRPGSADKHDWQIRRRELVTEYVPPLVLRNLRADWHIEGRRLAMDCLPPVLLRNLRKLKRRVSGQR